MFYSDLIYFLFRKLKGGGVLGTCLGVTHRKCFNKEYTHLMDTLLSASMILTDNSTWCQK